MAKRSREKAEQRAKNNDKRPFASAKYIRMSPVKVQRVLNLVRGQSYNDAIVILENLPHAAAKVIKKVFDSAAANAEHNLGMNKDDLIVAECWTTSGPTLKRLIYKAKGNASKMLKRTCHIYCVLDNAK